MLRTCMSPTCVYRILPSAFSPCSYHQSVLHRRRYNAENSFVVADNGTVNCTMPTGKLDFSIEVIQGGMLNVNGGVVIFDRDAQFTSTDSTSGQATVPFGEELRFNSTAELTNASITGGGEVTLAGNA